MGGIDQDPQPSWIAARISRLFLFLVSYRGVEPNARFSDFVALYLNRF